MTAPPKTVLLRGTDTELGEPVAVALLTRGATVAIYDPENPARGEAFADYLITLDLPGVVVDLCVYTGSNTEPHAPFAALLAQGYGLDAAVHLHLPDRRTTAESLYGYPAKLRAMMNAALTHMRGIGSPGIVINQFLMPTLLADSHLAAAMAEARNSLTGLTRTACVRFGHSGMRTTSLLVGLLDLPSLRDLASERVNAANTPLGRWITPSEVANTIAFLSLDSGVMLGQMMLLDGGMTTGVNRV